jgi:hypothetical protein
VRSYARQISSLPDGRWLIELGLGSPKEQALVDLAGAGAAILSLAPVRRTLEDFFVQQVADAERDSAAAGLRSAR